MDAIQGAGTGLGSAMNKAVTGQSGSMGQKDFLKLMIAQVQHQDPMQPQTNGDFLGQLAQFSMNDGITKMQETIEQLAGSFQSNQALQASSLVGRKVLVNNNTLNLDATSEAKAAVDIPTSIDNLSASIYNSSGELVKKIALGQQPIGLYNFSWDGLNQKGERAPIGQYRVEVNGLYSGQEVALKTMTMANIDSVSINQNGEGLRLNVAGIGAVSLNDIKQIAQ
ncbi:MAG: flagellar hook assembly protein FlgD [Proteobacteria bacterium]|nr:flagellar hook assembly protein FlgD [Pseudomonadota bacterium]